MSEVFVEPIRTQCVELRALSDRVPDLLREAAAVVERTDLHLLSCDLQSEHDVEYGVVLRLHFRAPRQEARR